MIEDSSKSLAKSSGGASSPTKMLDPASEASTHSLISKTGELKPSTFLASFRDKNKA